MLFPPHVLIKLKFNKQLKSIPVVNIIKKN
jgi:hypothetical protein